MASCTQPEREKGYWIWAGALPPAHLYAHDVLYIHQGLIKRNQKGNPEFHQQGLFPSPQISKKIYLTIRMEMMDRSEQFLALLDLLIQRWTREGNTLMGIQLDFDSPSKKLDLYIDYLRWVRIHLPKNLRLSVTGLADWIAQPTPSHLTDLSQVADEVIFQLYEGRSPIPSLSDYLKRIEKLKTPFKLGILPSMIYDDPRFENIEKLPNFKGWTVFLKKEEPIRK